MIFLMVCLLISNLILMGFILFENEIRSYLRDLRDLRGKK